MTEPTINDLHILLVEQKGKIDLVLSKMADVKEWQEKHDTNDNVEHALLHKRISNVKFGNLAVTIFSAAVAIFTGTKVR